MEAEARAMEELKMAAENSKLQMQANVKAQYESELRHAAHAGANSLELTHCVHENADELASLRKEYERDIQAKESARLAEERKKEADVRAKFEAELAAARKDLDAKVCAYSLVSLTRWD